MHIKDSSDAIMTLADVAKYLRVGERTVLKMVHNGELPGARIGNQWRFMSSMVDEWLRSKTAATRPSDLTRLIEVDDGEVPLSRLVSESYILLDVQPGSPEDVLAQLSDVFVMRGDIDTGNQDKLIKELLHREKIHSTAIGNGVAFPHLRSPENSPISGPLILFGKCPEGTDFGSPDGNPTILFFLIVTNSVVAHLRVLARLTHMVKNTALSPKLIQAETEDDVLAAFLDVGSNLG